MSTVFSQSRFADSALARTAAETQVYPLLFPGCRLTFHDVTSTVRDMEYAVDVEVRVRVEGLRGPLWFTIQDRWRTDLAWMDAADITVTEWNIDTGLPSELHKLGAHLLVYGFYDKPADRIVQVAVADVPRMLHALTTGRLVYERRSRGDQTFVAFKIADLRNAGALMMARRFLARRAV